MRDPRLATLRFWKPREALPPERLEQARARAREIATAPADVAALREADAEFLYQPDAQQAFDEEFLAVVREAPDQLKSWTAVLGQALIEAREGLSARLLVREDESALLEASRRWQEETDPFAVLGQSLHYITILPEDDLYRWTELLLQVDPASGLRVLDGLLDPGLMSKVLEQPSVAQDRGLIEALIQAAPTMLDEHGAWLPQRSIALLLVTQLIVQHTAELWGMLYQAQWNLKLGHDDETQQEATRTIENIVEQELPQWLTRAFALLLELPDGVPLAVRYLGDLSHRTQYLSKPNSDRDFSWQAQRVCFETLVRSLSSFGVHPERFYQAWKRAEQLAADKATREAQRQVVRQRASFDRTQREGEGARTLHADGLPLLVSAAWLIETGGTASRDFKLFWHWFEELLEGRDPALQQTPDGAPLLAAAKLFGALTAKATTPDGPMRATYAKLEPQRRRGMYAFRYQDMLHVGAESIFLLRVGLYALTHWLVQTQSSRDRSKARELFFETYEAACRLWLTAVNDYEGHRRKFVTACFAYMPFLFERLDVALKRTLPRVAPDPLSLAEACAFLRRNGVEATNLPSLVAGAGFDLAAALRNAHQWSVLTGNEAAFPEHLQDLANELGVQLEPASAPPEPDGEQERRAGAALMQSVPWAAALLERLEADACHHLRILPLDVEGKIWVIQVTLPLVLRDRFGLAPDLRILVVKGRAQGRDLRRAYAEPEGRGDVDQDLFVVASDEPELPARLTHLAGPWGQRVPWPLTNDSFGPLAEQFERYLPTFDLFERRDPVKGRAFFGRRAEVDAIMAKLPRGQAVGVFGLRKVGKSSLLQAVFEGLDPAGAARAWLGSRGEPPRGVRSEALVVWLDVQGLALRTKDALAERLCDALRERLQWVEGSGREAAVWFGDDGSQGPRVLAGEQGALAPLDELRRLLERTISGEDAAPVCFIFDEYDLLFEGYGGEPAMEGVEQVFALLRSLAQTTGRISVALIGRDPVFVDRPLLNGFTNPLLGWVEPTPLGPFTDEEARELLGRIGRRVGLAMSPALMQAAYRWTGGHPMLLRQYGSAVYEASHESSRAPRSDDATGTQSRPGSARRQGHGRKNRHLPSALTAEAAEVVRVTELFLRRDAVHTICGEVRALLAARFPGSLNLLEEVASEPATRTSSVLARHGGESSREAKLLLDFGLLREQEGEFWVPSVYRDHFSVPMPESTATRRRQSGGELRSARAEPLPLAH